MDKQDIGQLPSGTLIHKLGDERGDVIGFISGTLLDDGWVMVLVHPDFGHSYQDRYELWKTVEVELKVDVWKKGISKGQLPLPLSHHWDSEEEKQFVLKMFKEGMTPAKASDKWLELQTGENGIAEFIQGPLKFSMPPLKAEKAKEVEVELTLEEIKENKLLWMKHLLGPNFKKVLADAQAKESNE